MLDITQRKTLFLFIFQIRHLKLFTVVVCPFISWLHPSFQNLGYPRCGIDVFGFVGWHWVNFLAVNTVALSVTVAKCENILFSFYSKFVPGIYLCYICPMTKEKVEPRKWWDFHVLTSILSSTLNLWFLTDVGGI